MAVSTVSGRRDLSRSELMLMVLVVTVMVVLFFNRLDNVEIAAEEAMLNARLQDMRSRLVELRLRILNQGDRQALSLDDVVQQMVPGEVLMVDREYQIDWPAIGPGEWVFVRETGALWYRVAHPDGLASSVGEPQRVHFQLETTFAATPISSESSPRLLSARLLRAAPGEAPPQPQVVSNNTK